MAKKKVAPVYLHLYHGRVLADTQMDDWGFEGPTIGPLRYVHGTYACDLKFDFTEDSGDAFKRFGFDSQSVRLAYHEDMIPFGGAFYGDFTVSTGGEPNTGPSKKELAEFRKTEEEARAEAEPEV